MNNNNGFIGHCNVARGIHCGITVLLFPMVLSERMVEIRCSLMADFYFEECTCSVLLVLKCRPTFAPCYSCNA